MHMQVILDSPFDRPGSAPIWAGRKESSGTGLISPGLEKYLHKSVQEQIKIRRHLSKPLVYLLKIQSSQNKKYFKLQ